jgi:hypothetical protein
MVPLVAQAAGFGSYAVLDARGGAIQPFSASRLLAPSPILAWASFTAVSSDLAITGSSVVTSNGSPGSTPMLSSVASASASAA